MCELAYEYSKHCHAESVSHTEPRRLFAELFVVSDSVDSSLVRAETSH